jgi:hypothetical protein
MWLSNACGTILAAAEFQPTGWYRIITWCISFPGAFIHIPSSLLHISAGMTPLTAPNGYHYIDRLFAAAKNYYLVHSLSR